MSLPKQQQNAVESTGGESWGQGVATPSPLRDPLEDLWMRAQIQDRQAASELIVHLYRPIYSFLRRQCRSDADAADLTQQAFCQMWKSLPHFKGQSSFSTWMHGIAFNVYRAWRRKWNPSEQAPDDWWEACPAAALNPFQNASEKDLSHRLFSLVKHLNDEQRHSVELHYYQGLSIEETAQAMAVSSSTVKYRLREGIKHLRQLMQDDPHSSPQP